MNLNKAFTPVVAAALLSAYSGVQASTLSIETSTSTVNLSDIITLQIMMDFTDDATLGGGFDILFDPNLVSYIPKSYLTDPTLGSDPDFTRDDDPSVLDASKLVEVQFDRLVGAAFGSFSGLSGPSVVGSLSFVADTAGTAMFSVSASTSSSVGGFFSANTFDEQFPNFTGTAVTISGIPIPATFWLFGSGLLGLVGIARRSTT